MPSDVSTQTAPATGSASATAQPSLAEKIEKAALDGLIEGVQKLVTAEFGDTVSEAGVRVMHDAVALAAKPGWAAAKADLPDLFAFVSSIAAKQI